MREAEARQLRSEIDRLERGLIEAANSKAKWNLHEVAHTLRWQKARLRRLQECLDAMPEGKEIRTDSDRPAASIQPSMSATSATAGQGDWKVARPRNYGLPRER
ncbi:MULTISPECIES: hypothetical protein [unclassified Mesorhizobium]|uniref:hypothetical protein n=1 Tax=unclassified Mesorhizobium TaxID=325217 RepID=UPI001CCEE746|nr:MULTISPECIES: hypothetical protein [unclassified Mesorhizobium]MBZ9818033.1 hypothetical protein [Mesorhizobium sp. CA4]